MTFVTGDRVKETTTTTGTGDITLLGAVSAYVALSAICADGDLFCYAILGPTTEWEVGIGTWHSGNTFTRTKVLASSNAGALVNFSAGTKDVIDDHSSMQGRTGMVQLVAKGDVYLPPGTGMTVPRTYTIPAGVAVTVSAGAVLEVE